jgi:hypothetical protein
MWKGVGDDSLSTFPSTNIYGMIIHITTCMDLVPFLFSLSRSVRCLCVMLIGRDPYHSFMTLDVTSKIGGPPFGAPGSCPDKQAATKSKERRLCRDSLSCSQLPGAANKFTNRSDRWNSFSFSAKNRTLCLESWELGTGRKTESPVFGSSHQYALVGGVLVDLVKGTGSKIESPVFSTETKKSCNSLKRFQVVKSIHSNVHLVSIYPLISFFVCRVT